MNFPATDIEHSMQDEIDRLKARIEELEDKIRVDAWCKPKLLEQKARIEELEVERDKWRGGDLGRWLGRWLGLALTEALDERDRLRMALVCPPILSKYHGKHGFEVERFISDYSVWISAARAALDGGK